MFEIKDKFTFQFSFLCWNISIAFSFYHIISTIIHTFALKLSSKPFWMEISDVPGICLSRSSFGVTPDIFCSSSFNPWYFSGFSCSLFLMLWFLRIATSITVAVFWCLSCLFLTTFSSVLTLGPLVHTRHRCFCILCLLPGCGFPCIPCLPASYTLP